MRVGRQQKFASVDEGEANTREDNANALENGVSA